MNYQKQKPCSHWDSKGRTNTNLFVSMNRVAKVLLC